MVFQVIRSPGRGRFELRQPPQGLRILKQQREIRRTATEGFEQIEDADQGFIGMGGGQTGVDHQRSQGIETAAGGFRHLLIAVPAAGGLKARGDKSTIAVTQTGQTRCHVILPCWCGIEPAFPVWRPEIFPGRTILVRIGKDGLEIPGDRLAMIVEFSQQRVKAGKGHGKCHGLLIFRRCRQAVRLCVIEILQTMLQAAQENIGGRQLTHGIRTQLPTFSQERQDLPGRLDLQGFVTPATNQLENLGDKLDLADAARAELDVTRHIFAGDFATYLGMQFAHGVDGPEIEVFPEDERTAQGFEIRQPALQNSLIACHRGQRPGLDPGIAFPFTPLGDEIIFQRVEAAHQRAGIPVGTKPHVDPKDLALACHVGNGVDELPPQPREEVEIVDTLQAMFLAVGFTFFGVDKNQVDIRRNIELAAAELAHADDDELLGHAVCVTRCAITRCQCLHEYPLRRGQADFRDQRHGLGHFLQRSQPGQIPRDDARKGTLLELAQGGLEVIFGERLRQKTPDGRSIEGFMQMGEQFPGQGRAGSQQAGESAGSLQGSLKAFIRRRAGGHSVKIGDYARRVAKSGVMIRNHHGNASF